MCHASTLLKKPTAVQSLILSISPNLLKKQSLYSLMTIWPVMICMCPFSSHIGAVTAESASMRVHNDIMISLDNGNRIILVLLDPSAAFDTVNHDLLLSRLEKPLDYQSIK